MLNGGQPRFFRAQQADWISQKTRKGLQKMVEMKYIKTRKHQSALFLTEWKIYGTFFGKHK